MTGLIEVPLQGGGSMLVEADEELEQGTVRVGRPGELVATAGQTLESAFDRVRAMAEAIVDRLHSIEVPPASVQVELGVKLTAQAGVVIAKSCGEGNIKITLSWCPGRQEFLEKRQEDRQ